MRIGERQAGLEVQMASNRSHLHKSKVYGQFKPTAMEPMMAQRLLRKRFNDLPSDQGVRLLQALAGPARLVEVEELKQRIAALEAANGYA